MRVAVLGRLSQSLALYGALEGMHLGAEVHVLEDLRPDRQAKALAERRVALIYLTPAQARLLVEGEGKLPALRHVLIGGSKLDAALRLDLMGMAPGAEVHEFYGAAEASFMTLAGPDSPAASVGRAYPGVEIKVDVSGLIWVKSPYLFEGYAGDDPGGARWSDGFLTVGEIGALRDGHLYLSGRAGRMVTVADQNVFPEEIEAFLMELPGVRQVAVVPVADALRGMHLVAVLQGNAIEEEAILRAARGRLGALKAPKRLIWREDWPVLLSGKTDLLAIVKGMNG
jgi:long-chain acyl-CoA synthetase